MTGTLSLVGTPIGNLGDITYRAVECLKNAGRIYAEDTRRTKVLLSHLGIEGKRLLSLHAHSQERDIKNAIEILSSGEDVALVTDAGMPGISDPGSELVRAARAAKLAVTVVPGPSAVTTAVALSGLVDGPFTFLGFLPRKGSKRRKMLQAVAQSPIPTVLFESPHRVKETLEDLRESCGPDRVVSISRELTKKFEETRVVSLIEATVPAFFDPPQGEFTLVVDRGEGLEAAGGEIDIDERARELLAAGNSVKDVSHQLARELEKNGEKHARRELYARIQQLQTGEELEPAPGEDG